MTVTALTALRRDHARRWALARQEIRLTRDPHERRALIRIRCGIEAGWRMLRAERRT